MASMPELRCEHCGTPREGHAGACRACGEPGPAPEAVGNAAGPWEPPGAWTANASPPPASRWRWVVVVVALAVAQAGYRVLVLGRLEQTAALFIGLPALLSGLIILTPPAQSLTGTIMKTITLALCLSGVLLGEGMICVLMAAPIAYLVGLAVGLAGDAARRKAAQERQSPGRFLPLAVLAPLLAVQSMEGTSEALSFPRGESVTVTRRVPMGAEALRERLGRPADVSRPLPALLRIGFPRPVSASGEGLAPGSTRQVGFAGGEGKPGTLTMAVTEAAPASISFRAVSDTSHIAHWLDWRAARLSWREMPGGWCELTCTLHYERRLDPAWYFGPAERLAVRHAALHLVDMLTSH